MQKSVDAHTRDDIHLLSVDPLSSPSRRRRPSPPPRAKAGQQPRSAMSHTEHSEREGGDSTVSGNK